MKVIKKLIIAVVLICCIMALFNVRFNEVKAADEFETQADDFIKKGHDQYIQKNVEIDKITDEFIDLGQILSYIGAGVMVAVTAYLGVQYIISPPDKQGALKEKLVGLVVSGIVIFGAYAIWKLVISIVSSF